MAYTKQTWGDKVGVNICLHLENSRMIILKGYSKQMDMKEFYNECCEIKKEFGISVVHPGSFLQFWRLKEKIS